MDKKQAPPSTINEYIARCPAEVQPILNKLRATIHQAAPKAEERISYQMPAFFQNGVLVYFGAHPQHIGFYPTPAGIEAFKQELARYKSAKGSVQFPLDQPIPYALVTKIVKFRVKANDKK